MATFTFLTKSGKTAILTIDGANVSGSCYLAAEPIITEVDSDDDFFCPIRTQSGTIKIIGSVSDLEGIMGDTPMDRPVSLSIDNVVVWKGYLQGSGYSQDWIVGPNEIDVPIVSPLTLAESITINPSDRGWTSFSDFVSDMNEELGTPYTSIIVPERNEDYFEYRFNRKHYISFDDDSAAYVGESYKKVLEDICNLFGWQCQEYGSILYFLSLDQEYSVAESLEIANDSHSIDYLAGKKSVEVNADFNNSSDEYVKIDTDDMTVRSYQYTSKQIDSYKYYYAQRTYTPNSLFVMNGNINAKYLDFTNDVTSNRGSCICEERTEYTSGGYYGDIQGDSSYVTRMSWRLAQGQKVCQIFSNDSVEGIDNDEYLILSFSAKQTDSANNPFETCPDGLSPFSIDFRIGDFHYNFNSRRWTTTDQEQRVYLHNGNLYPNAAEDVAFGGFAIPFRNGDIEINIYAYDEDIYCCFENFTIKKVLNWTVGDAVKDLPIKQNYYIGNGFVDDYKIEPGLACRKHKHQISEAFIRDDSTDDYVRFPESICSNGKRPEVDYADRLKAYYSQTRKRISATVKYVGNSLSPLKIYSVSTMSNYACLSQSVNWRDEEVTGQFFERP